MEGDEGPANVNGDESVKSWRWTKKSKCGELGAGSGRKDLFLSQRVERVLSRFFFAELLPIHEVSTTWVVFSEKEETVSQLDTVSPRENTRRWDLGSRTVM